MGYRSGFEFHRSHPPNSEVSPARSNAFRTLSHLLCPARIPLPPKVSFTRALDITPFPTLPYRRYLAVRLTSTTGPSIMCYFELVTYHCQHQVHRRCSYCHFARNDQNHACFGVKVLRRTVPEPREDCDACVRHRERQQQQKQQQQSQFAVYQQH